MPAGPPEAVSGGHVLGAGRLHGAGREHGAGGAAALIINQPSESSIKRMFARMDMPLLREDLQTTPVYNGGPVFTERGFVLHEVNLIPELRLQLF